MNRIAPACSGECTGAIRNVAGSGVTGGESAAFTSLNFNAGAAWRADTRTPSDGHLVRNWWNKSRLAEVATGPQHLLGTPQTHGFPAPRFQRWPRAPVPPISLPDSAVRHGVVDIPDPIPHALNQLSNRSPVAAAKPCWYCGRYPGHHEWCGRPNVRVSFHPKKLIGLDGTWHATGSEA